MHSYLKIKADQQIILFKSSSLQANQQHLIINQQHLIVKIQNNEQITEIQHDQKIEIWDEER